MRRHDESAAGLHPVSYGAAGQGGERAHAQPQQSGSGRRVDRHEGLHGIGRAVQRDGLRHGPQVGHRVAVEEAAIRAVVVGGGRLEVLVHPAVVDRAAALG